MSQHPATAVILARRASQKMDADDERLVIITDENHPLYDERVHIPIEDLEDLALSLADGGQMKPILVRKNGEKFEVVDGRQEVKAARWANERIELGDPRFDFRGGAHIELDVNIRLFEDERELVGAKRRANASIKDTPGIRARNVKHDLKFLSKLELSREMGVTEAYIDEILSYFDLDAEVQKKVDTGVVKETVAREMIKRGADGGALDRASQREVIQEMEEKGATKGTKAKAIIRAKKKGTVAKLDSKKMRNRQYIERFYEEIEAAKSPPMLAVRAFIDHILRRKSAVTIQAFPGMQKAANKLSGPKAEQNNGEKK